MENAALTIPFAAIESAPATDLVLLEQEAWGAYAGRLTGFGLTRYLDHVLYAGGGSAVPQVVDCGQSGGNLDTAVLVWPLREDVRYRLFCTVGQLGAGVLGEIEETDTVSFTLTETASIKHPARRILDAEWLTGPWTTGGVKIAPPPLAVDGRELRTNLPVYGSVRVRILARRYRHPLRIPWAEAQTLLAAPVWSEWAVCLPAPGSPVALALTANKGARDVAQSGDECGRSEFRLRHEDDDWPPEAEAEDRHLDCDYCTGECEEKNA